MTFDFNEIVERRNSGSYKWDTPSNPDTLPMWVADMDFRTAPPIIDALRRRVEHGIFGYTLVPGEYYKAVIDWFENQHGWTISREWFIYTSGVVPAISAIIKACARPGDKVITLTPSYNCFFSSIRNNDCRLSSCPLIYDNGRYTIDFDLLDALASDSRASIFLLCNPHNPSGRVWSTDELRRMGDICLHHNVLVVSDEIHCELTFDGHRYTPYASLGDEYRQRSVSCISPSKAFNIAGLQIANIIASDAALRARIDKAINVNEVCDVNPFGVAATIAAYSESLPWLQALREYIWGNYLMLRNELQKHCLTLKVVPLEGTYLAWIDISQTGLTDKEAANYLLEKHNLMFNPGSMYGTEGKNFLRLNLACPRPLLSKAIDILKTEF